MYRNALSDVPKTDGGMCEDCGVFFEKQEFIITDFSNKKIKHRRKWSEGLEKT